MTDNKWEVFMRPKAPTATEPLITVQTRGNMSMNQVAWTAIGEPEAVELLWNASERMIGIRPAGDQAAKHAYRLRGSDHASTHVLSIIAFAQHSGIEINTTASQRYVAEVKDGMLVVDLKRKPLEILSPLRGRPRKRRES